MTPTRKLLLLSLAAGLILVPGSSRGMPATELERIDLDGNRCLSGREKDLYLTYLGNPILRAFDVGGQIGSLDEIEIRAIETTTNPKLAMGFDETQLDEARLDMEQIDCYPIAELTDPQAPQGAIEAAPQRFFFRNNRLDVSIYNKKIDAKAAEGGTISLIHDGDSGETSVGISGTASYVLARDTHVPPLPGSKGEYGYFSAYALAPWLQIDWLENTDTGVATRDKLVFGADAQLEYFGGPAFGNQVLTASPYFQTVVREELPSG